VENLTINGSETLNVSTNLTVGNLTVEDSGTLRFGNASWSATLTVWGSIFLSGHGRFIVHDGYVGIAPWYSGARGLFAYDDSLLQLDDAVWGSVGGTLNLALYDRANLTVNDSDFEYPNSWTDVNVYGNASEYVVNSEFDGDTGVQDSGPTPATAHLTFVDSAGFHLWFDFRNGSVANLTLPSPDVETTATYPPAGSTGIDYRVRLLNSWPGLYAVLLYGGANLTVHDTGDLDTSFLPVGATFQLTDLREVRYSELTLDPAGARLRLINVSVESWNFYPVGSNVSISGSDVGEAWGWTGSVISLTDCELTGDGGLYGVFDTSQLIVRNSSVHAPLQAWGNSRILLANSTMDVPGTESLLAAENATITLQNATIAPGTGMLAVAQGRIVIQATEAVEVEDPTGPAPGARVVARWTANGTLASTALGDGAGVAELILVVDLQTALATVSEGAYTFEATAGGSVGEVEGNVTGPATWLLQLTPFILWSLPENDTFGVPLFQNLTLGFGFVMDTGSVPGALTISPAVAWRSSWNEARNVLTLEPVAGWPAATTVTVTLGLGATTAAGISLPTVFTLLFATGSPPNPPPPPMVISTAPSNDAVGVDLQAALEVVFSQPMDPESTEAAFSIQPAALGSLAVTGANLTWSGLAPLDPNTTYVVTVAPTASNSAHVELNNTYEFQFSTIPWSEIPQVVRWAPENRSLLNGPPSSVSVQWNVPMDPDSTISAFTVLPATVGTVSVLGATLTWTPLRPLEPGATYLLQVSSSARSAAGVGALGDFWASFSIRPPSLNTTASASPPPWGVYELLFGATGAVVGATLGYAVGRYRRRPSLRPGRR
jgi:hypothetical protein